jgi:uncharacterized membrane protein YjjP (DUF1212 family)
MIEHLAPEMRRRGMSQKSRPLPMLVGGVLITAVLATLLVKGGWLIWLPVILALLIVYYLGRLPSR